MTSYGGFIQEHWTATPKLTFDIGPLGLGRDSFTTPTFASLDLRTVKYLRFAENRHLDLVVEFFNLLNHRNVVQVNPLYGVDTAPLPSFSQPIDAANPRQVQFSIDFEF